MYFLYSKSIEPSINQLIPNDFISHYPFMPFKLNKNEQFCNMPTGTLFLIPVPLAEDAAAKSFTPFLTDTINSLKEYIVENEKTARRFLKLAGLKTPQSELVIHDYGKYSRDSIKSFFVGLNSGKDVGLMSEAGCPGVADPGAEIVAEAH